MNSLAAGIILFAILIGLSFILAYWHDGGKVYIAIGLGMQILGFVSLLSSQTTLSIRDHDLFDKLFHKRDNVVPEVQGGIHLGKYAGGIWLIMIGLTIQLLGLFLI